MALYAGQVQTAPYQSPDYGPSVAAARELAMTGAQGMAGMVSQVGDYFKQQGDAKKSAQLGIKIAEAAKIMDPNQAPYYDNLIFSMKDENTPVQVRGALGASVQDLLKQNTSMRAVAVQEQQMGMRPPYFGGVRQTATRPTYNASAISQAARASRGVDTSQGDAALANQPEGSQNLIPQDNVVLGGVAGAEAEKIANLIQEAQTLGVPAERVNRIATGVEQELKNPSQNTPNAIRAWVGNLESLVTESKKGLDIAKDSKGQPQIVVSEDESGNVSRFTKTHSGNLVNEFGEVLTPQGKPIEQQQYKRIDTDAIQRSLYENYDMDGRPIPQGEPGSLLPGLPQGDAGNLPPEASRTRPPSFQELTAVPTTPEGGVQRIGEQEPQPEQKSAGLGLMAKESQIKQTQASGEELKRLTELSPRKAKLYESALNQAYQDVATAPSENVIKEMELQLLMKPESKGAQVMSEEEYNRRNISTINKAKIRARDRAGMYKILERFDVIQQLANHSEASKVFGNTITEEKLRELARTEGGVYALYENLKGQDLVQAMADIKAQSGTAANMSERETFALQSAVSAFNLKQDWNSAQKSLMQMANTAIRAGKNLGADDSIFDTSPMTPATYDANGKKLTEASKRQISRANEILNAPQTLPLFKDEIEYFKRVNALQNRLQTSQGAGTTPTQNAPVQQPVGPDAARSNLDILFDLNR
jgi:hypothetical protein